MKKAFLCLTVLIAFHANGQKLFSEGNVRYEVEVYTHVGAVPDSFTYLMMVKGGNIRTELSGAIGKSTYIYDLRESTGVALREFGGQKIMIPLERNSWTEICSPFSPLTYTSVSGDSTVLNYTSKKVSAAMTDGSILTIWFTDEINPELKEVNFPMANLNGFPLVIEMRKGTERVIYKAISLNFDPVPVQYYDIPKTGFRIMKYEESKKIK